MEAERARMQALAAAEAQAEADAAARAAAEADQQGTENGASSSDAAARWLLPELDVAAARVNQLLDTGLADRRAWTNLVELCTVAPKRLAGSPGFERAVEWGEAAMRDAGLVNIRREPVMVPRWVRGEVETCSARSVDGTPIDLAVVALGGSIGTAPGGLSAEIVEVDGLAGVEAAGERLRGKIAYLSQPMDPTVRTSGAAYGKAVPQRIRGAIEAAKFGAVGVLVRSMSTARDDLPHTGAMRYADGVTKIPAAALGVLSAERLSAAVAAGPVRVNLELDCETLPDIEQWNVVGELPGSDLVGEIMVVGGHLDAWGTGVGAHDDGAGVAQSVEAARLLKAIGFQPRRTIRVVLFANEENGLAGGRGYAERHGAAEKHVLAMETDSGAFGPRGIGASFSAAALERFRPYGQPLEVIGAERLYARGGGADIGPLAQHGALMSSLRVNDERYFDYHHAASDTLDNVNPREIELGAVVMAYWLSLFANCSEEALGID